LHVTSLPTLLPAGSLAVRAGNSAARLHLSPNVRADLSEQFVSAQETIMRIGARKIDYDMPPYIVAEISCNHNGDIKKALDLIDASVAAGADAVKFQTYTPGDLCKPENEDLWRLYERAMTPREWHPELFDHCRKAHITAFSSPFSVHAVEYLEREIQPPCYKIASPEALRHDIVGAVAKTGKPVIVSTGALSGEGAIDDLWVRLGPEVVFLHCIARYPAEVIDGNFNAIKTLKKEGRLVGLSDHTPGYTAAVAATALGIVMIEKHIKLDNDCIDSEWSLNPKQFLGMTQHVTDVFYGMGTGQIEATCKPRAL
jgi:sialic acid synthase SpsE